MSLVSTKGLFKAAALAVAGAATLGAGNGHALTCSLAAPGSCAGGTIGQFTISNLQATGAFGSTPVAQLPTITFTSSGSQGQILSFTTNGGIYFSSTPSPALYSTYPQVGSFSFTVTTPAIFPLLSYTPSAIFTNGTAPSTFTFSGTGATTNTVAGNTVASGSISPGITSGTYTYAWNTSGDTLISNAIGGFTSDVPGPLPAVGAAVAFGFSRKLRRRLKPVV